MLRCGNNMASSFLPSSCSFCLRTDTASAALPVLGIIKAMLELRAWMPGSMLCCLCSASPASQHKQTTSTAPQPLLAEHRLRLDLTQPSAVLSLHPQVTASDMDNKWANLYICIFFFSFLFFFFFFWCPWATTLNQWQGAHAHGSYISKFNY